MVYQQRIQADSASDSPDVLASVRALSPVAFEHWVADMLRLHNPAADVRPIGGSGDRGVDVIVEDADGMLVVQCKRYAPNQLVGSPDMQMFLGAMMHRRTDRGAFITTSGFTAEARAIGEAHRIWLVDAAELTILAVKFDPAMQEKQRIADEAAQWAEEERARHEYEQYQQKAERRRMAQEAAAADHLRYLERKKREADASAKRIQRERRAEEFWNDFAAYFFVWGILLGVSAIYAVTNMPTYGSSAHDVPTLVCSSAGVAAVLLYSLIRLLRKLAN